MGGCWWRNCEKSDECGWVTRLRVRMMACPSLLLWLLNNDPREVLCLLPNEASCEPFLAMTIVGDILILTCITETKYCLTVTSLQHSVWTRWTNVKLVRGVGIVSTSCELCWHIYFTPIKRHLGSKGEAAVLCVIASGNDDWGQTLTFIKTSNVRSFRFRLSDGRACEHHVTCSQTPQPLSEERTVCWSQLKGEKQRMLDFTYKATVAGGTEGEGGRPRRGRLIDWLVVWCRACNYVWLSSPF